MDQIIKDLKNAHQHLQIALNSIDQDQSVNQNWSKTHLLAHINGWYQEGLVAIPQILNGEKPKSLKISVNKFNEISLEDRKNKTYEDLLEEFESSHQKLLKLIESLDEKQLNADYGIKLGKMIVNPIWIINETISHDNAHAQEIEEKLKE